MKGEKKMNKKMNYRKIVCLVLALCLMLGSTCSSAFAESQATFGNTQKVVDTFNGVPAYYKIGAHDRDDTYSCAAFVRRYYTKVFGVSVSNMFKNATPYAGSKGYSFRKVDPSEAIPGDIGYQTGSSGGHWFIIKTVCGERMTVIEQNWKNGSTNCTVNRVVGKGITPNFKVFRLTKNGKDMNGSPRLLEDGRYALMVNGLKCLNVQFASKIPSAAKICIDRYDGEKNELFDISYVSGYYRISPVHAQNLALSGKHGKGQQLCCDTWKDGDDYSLWIVEELNDGYRFQNKGNKDLYIDVNHNLKDMIGNRINLWTKVNGSQQTFYPEKADYVDRGFGPASAVINVTPAIKINYATATTDYSGRWAIMANDCFCLNVQFASRICDAAKCVIDGYNGEKNEVFDFMRYGNYYRISPVHAPELAVNAQYGKDAKAGQQLSLHTWREGDAASLWSIEEYGNGVRFRNKANTSLVIDVTCNQKSTTGCKIILWNANGDEAQRFYLKRA